MVFKGEKYPEVLCNSQQPLLCTSSDKFLDHCGIVGMISDFEVAPVIYQALRALQHRGQEAAGIATFKNGVSVSRGMGLVHDVFNEETLEDLKGTLGIGHVRYSTTGTSVLQNAQPVVASSHAGDMALAHNGDIVNSDAIRGQLKDRGWAFITTSDSEVIVRLLANEITATQDITKALKNLMKRLVGSYSITLLINDRIFAVRDPYGIKPLCIGKLGNCYITASESVVFDAIGAEFIRDVTPGEVVELSKDGVKSTHASIPKHQAHCMFEWVYFSRADSVIDGRLVYNVRWNIGRSLAEDYPVEADLVVPVPDSGRTHALGYSHASGIPYTEGLIKNRYVWRTFIMPKQLHRKRDVRLKMNPIRRIVEGKRIVLVDDSIVRGNTMERIVSILRDAGTEEVHVRIGCPPIVAPCYFGIDMKTRDQFIAHSRTVPEIAKTIGADSLGYLSIDRLVECIGIVKNDLCLGCLTGAYPVAVPGEKHRFQKSLEGFS
ncbi:MAG: amidophosphoribosyltransferase [Thermoplasmata archaeon]|nr:MAG: amidophosphoribosyltransferase [Thermoplasmata archaeon]